MEDFSKVDFRSGNGNHPLGANALRELTELSGQECRFGHVNYNKYPDGEFDNRIVNFKILKDGVAVVYQSMYSQELFDEVLDLIWAIKHQYGAKYIIGVFPFFWNRRQDPMMEESEKEKWSKKTPKPDEIQRLRKNIHLLKTCGVDEMIVATPHSSAMGKACEEYGIKFHEIDPSHLFATALQTFIPAEEQSLVTVYSPDAGSIPRAINLAKILHCPVLFNLKNRAINDRTSIAHEELAEIERLTTEFRSYYKFEDIYYATPEIVSGKIIVIVEDEAASCGTANDTGRLLQQFGVKSIFFMATHAVLTWGWRNKLFYCNPFTKIIMTDSIPRGYEKRTGGKIFDISLSSLFASVLFKIIKKL